MTGIIANGAYAYLEMDDLLPIEQKACRRNSGGIKDQLLINEMVLNDCKIDILSWERHGLIIRKLMI